MVSLEDGSNVRMAFGKGIRCPLTTDRHRSPLRRSRGIHPHKGCDTLLWTTFLALSFNMRMTLILVKADMEQILKLRSILKMLSVLLVWRSITTRALSSLSVSVLLERAADLATALGCPISSFPKTYLGLPLSDPK